MGLDRERLSQIRKKRGLTHHQAATAAGMANRQAWYKIESGDRDNLTLETLDRIAAALGVQPAELLLPIKLAKPHQATSEIESFVVDLGAFAFLNGEPTFTRGQWFDVEPAGASFVLVMRGEDKMLSSQEDASSTPALVWNDAAGAHKRIVIATYTREADAKADAAELTAYARSRHLEGRPVLGVRAQAIQNLLRLAYNESNVNTTRAHTGSFATRSVRSAQSAARKAQNAVKLLESNGAAVAFKLPPAKRAQFLAELVSLSTTVVAPASRSVRGSALRDASLARAVKLVSSDPSIASKLTPDARRKLFAELVALETPVVAPKSSNRKVK